MAKHIRTVTEVANPPHTNTRAVEAEVLAPADDHSSKASTDVFEDTISDDAMGTDGISDDDIVSLEIADDNVFPNDIDILPSESNDINLPVPTGDRFPDIAGTHDTLRAYLREMGRFPMLNSDEEFELARRVRDEHDNEAAFRLVSSHLRLVVRIAMDFQRRWMQNVLDLIQEGNVGLLRAVNKFDPDKGIKFSYYAAFWIRAYILKFIMDNWRMVKIGTTQAQRKLFYNLNRERQKLIAAGFDPDSAVLAERLGVDTKQIVEMEQRLDTSDMSLNAPVNDDSGSATHMDFLPALGPGVDDACASNEISSMVREKLNEIIPSLSEKEIYILKHRLLTDDPITLREIGEKYKVTRERVRQLEGRLLQKLKTHFGKSLPDFSEDWVRDDDE